MSTRPVVVYGASGYTGRLVCEFLRHYGLPFVAAGRDKARLESAMRLVPGIETLVTAHGKVVHVGAADAETVCQYLCRLSHRQADYRVGETTQQGNDGFEKGGA